MKKNILFLPLLGLLALGSCNILDKEPLPSIAPSNFFNNADDAEAAITSAYDGLQRTGLYGQDLNVVGEMPSDDCTSINGDVNALEIINWFPFTSQVNNVWNDSYAGINRANAVLKYVPTIDMPTDRRYQITGEAYFLRALHYFNLVRLYGGVPLRVTPTESGDPASVQLARATPEQIYTQIADDLTKAESLTAATFGDKVVDRARATKTAVQALQARVYLTTRQWPLAQAAAAKVLSAGGYALAGNFGSLYPADNNLESIFEVQFAANADGGFILPDLLLPNPPATYSFSKFNIPTLFRSAADAKPTDLTAVVDTARDGRWKRIGKVTGGVSYNSVVFGGKGTGNDQGYFVYKWRSNPNGFNSPDNYYVLRLADVYLMFAEASNEQTGPNADALARLNTVRTRAQLPALTLTDLPTKEAFRAEVDKQRRLELAFEGERWFDLLRYTSQVQADPTATHAVTALDMIEQQRQTRDAKYLLFPIPQGELNNNVLAQQNPGF